LLHEFLSPLQISAWMLRGQLRQSHRLVLEVVDAAVAMAGTLAVVCPHLCD